MRRIEDVEQLSGPSQTYLSAQSQARSALEKESVDEEARALEVRKTNRLRERPKGAKANPPAWCGPIPFQTVSDAHACFAGIIGRPSSIGAGSITPQGLSLRMSKKKIYGNCKAKSKEMQRTPKFLEMAFPESPSNKCLTHIIGGGEKTESNATSECGPKTYDEQS